MSAREGVRASNRIRVLRVMMVPFLAWNLFLGAFDAASGSLLALVNFTCVLLLAGVVVLQTCLIRRIEKREEIRGSLPEAALRRAFRRPRRTMTPVDYRLLADLERELGWEPSEPCMPVKVPEPLVPGTGFAAFSKGAADVSAAALSGSGALSAKARTVRECECRRCGDDIASVQVRSQDSAAPVTEFCFECFLEEQRARMRAVILMPKPDLGDLAGDLARDMRDLRDLNRAGPAVPSLAEPDGEVTAHFAALARVGRDRCLSPCPYCDARDSSAQVLDGLVSGLEGDRRELAQANERDGTDENAQALGFRDAEDLKYWFTKGRFGE